MISHHSKGIHAFLHHGGIAAQPPHVVEAGIGRARRTGHHKYEALVGGIPGIQRAAAVTEHETDIQRCAQIASPIVLPTIGHDEPIFSSPLGYGINADNATQRITAGEGGNDFAGTVILMPVPQTPQPVTGAERLHESVIRHGGVGHLRHNFIQTLHFYVRNIGFIAGRVINRGHVAILRQEKNRILPHMRRPGGKLGSDKAATAKAHQHTIMHILRCHFLPIAIQIRHNRNNGVLNRSAVFIIDSNVRGSHTEYTLVAGKIHVVLQVIARVHHAGRSGVGKRAESSESSQQGTTKRKVQMQFHSGGTVRIWRGQSTAPPPGTLSVWYRISNAMSRQKLATG